MSAPDPTTQRAARAAVDALFLAHDGIDVRPWRGGWLVTVWDAPRCRPCGGSGTDPERHPARCGPCKGSGHGNGPRTVATYVVDEDGRQRPIAAVQDDRKAVPA